MKWLLALTTGAVFWANFPRGSSVKAQGAAEEPSANDHAPAGGWMLADLEQTMKSLNGRSYENGRRMFERAHCSKCHRFNGIGVEFGPDLAKLDLRFKPIDILRDILDPSRRIADAKYDLWIFEIDDGRVVTGLIGKRTEQTLEVMEKPPGDAPAVVLQRSQIEQRWMSLGSVMPKGLLDEFMRDEISDLVAYVAARGDPSDPLIRMSGCDEPPPAPKPSAASSDAKCIRETDRLSMRNGSLNGTSDRFPNARDTTRKHVPSAPAARPISKMPKPVRDCCPRGGKIIRYRSTHRPARRKSAITNSTVGLRFAALGRRTRNGIAQLTSTFR